MEHGSVTDSASKDRRRIWLLYILVTFLTSSVVINRSETWVNVWTVKQFYCFQWRPLIPDPGYDDTTIRRYDYTIIRRYDDTTIRRYEDTTIRRYEDTTIRRYEDTTIRRYDDGVKLVSMTCQLILIIILINIYPLLHKITLYEQN